MPKSQRSKLIKKADELFSEYIRRKYADDMGMVKCFTCGKKTYWYGEGMQCGHFISRSCIKLRWDETNARPQCYRCNVALNGNYPIYAENIGIKEIKRLNKESNLIRTVTINDIENTIEELKTKLHDLYRNNI